jgi:hypothetical protein
MSPWLHERDVEGRSRQAHVRARRGRGISRAGEILDFRGTDVIFGGQGQRDVRGQGHDAPVDAYISFL